MIRGDTLDITYKTRKLEKICTDAKAAEKAHGREMAGLIHQRIDEIAAADTVEDAIRYSMIAKGNMLLTWFTRTGWFLRNTATRSRFPISWK